MQKKPPFARKRFGQHFLCERSIVERTIASANISSQDHIIEIGPGRGALTSKLLKTQATLTVIEIDRDLAADLTASYDTNPRFRLINEDILKSDWSAIIKQDCTNKVIANLPYNISTPVFFRLVRFRAQLAAITIMVQKEVAERIVHRGAGNRLKDYGVLSVISGNVFDATILFPVPASAFYPQPKVESAVIQLIPNHKQLVEEERFFNFVKNAFNLRRKRLINHLKKNETSLYNQLAEEDKAYLENLRAENLSPDQYYNLYYRGKLND
jgi:16S rRNA (adenine1518-N6/adenine1519-N6)-dimethyltransferase